MKKILTYLFLSTSALTAEQREWTSTSGEKVKAELISVDHETITLARAKDGRSFSVNVNQFSAEDQEFVKNWFKQQPKENVENEINPIKKSIPITTDATDNFDAEWPKLVVLKKDFDINTISETDEGFIYESRHFRFTADARLQKSVVKRFAEIFECTLVYMQQLPISSQKAINHTAENKKDIYLFADAASYNRAGGPVNSAGVYMGGKDIIMVSMSSLGLKKVGKGYSLDRKRGLGTLPHEIVHMFTDYEYYAPGARGWFSEGLAEYVSSTPYRGAKFNVRGNKSSVVETVIGYGKNNTGGRNLGKDIYVGSLKAYMTQPYSSFTANSSLNYGVGSLIVYHFFHYDGNGDRQSINAFLKALKEKKPRDEALAALLNGRTFLELEQDIQKTWRSKGIKLTFSK